MRRQGAEFLKSASSFLMTLLFLLALRWFLIEPFVIPSGSMLPSLLINDHVFVQKYVYGLRLPFSQTWLWRWGSPQAGDIVVFQGVENPNIYMIKRVVAVAGDRLAVGASGQVSVNGKAWERTPVALSSFPRLKSLEMGSHFKHFWEQGPHEKYVVGQSDYRPDRSFGEYVVPDGHVCVMGDNRDNSHDSRFWGALPEEKLVGKAGVVWLSCDATLEAAPMICNPLTLRWERLFSSLAWD